jgi:hypothetical protein
VGVFAFPHLVKIKIRESEIRTMASPKGKNPGPGCLILPMER